MCNSVTRTDSLETVVKHTIKIIAQLDMTHGPCLRLFFRTQCYVLAWRLQLSHLARNKLAKLFPDLDCALGAKLALSYTNFVKCCRTMEGCESDDILLEKRVRPIRSETSISAYCLAKMDVYMPICSSVAHVQMNRLSRNQRDCSLDA